MYAYIVRRLFAMVLTLFGISVVVFMIVRLLPGDAISVLLGTEVTGLTDGQMAELRAYYGLDRPILEQYWLWLTAAVQGDMGVSFRTGRPVIQEVLARFPITLELTLGGLAVGILIGLPLGVVAAIKANTPVDTFASLFGLLGLSMPRFWLATLLILFFSLYFHWLPNSGGLTSFRVDPWANIQQLLMPWFSLGVSLAAAVMRMTRSSMLEVLSQDYVRTARGKGLTEQTVVVRHCLKNALIPVITIIGIQAGYLLGGTVVIEQIFALPGVGVLTLNAIHQRDYTLIQGAVLFIAFNFVLINFFVDLLYGTVDPRVRLR